MDDVYQNINDCNPIRKTKKLFVFDEMIAEVKGNKKLQALIEELFIRCRKLNILFVFFHSILFFCSKRCKIKYNTLFHHENKQQSRIKTYCN